jgi:MarR family transcriptional regulator for hemolysin
MERDGLIVRTRNPRDRRQVRAELTAAGRGLHDTLKAIATKTGRRACDGLSGDEQQMLRRLLEQIRTNVGGDDANRGAA